MLNNKMMLFKMLRMHLCMHTCKGDQPSPGLVLRCEC